MKKLLLLLSLFALNTMAQSIEPNLKWGTPTNEELTMSEYRPNKYARSASMKTICWQSSHISGKSGNGYRIRIYTL